MERNKTLVSTVSAALSAAIIMIFAFCIALPSVAGVILSPAEPPSTDDTEYPPSAFGAAPVHPLKMATAKESEPDRSPAGLVLAPNPRMSQPDGQNGLAASEGVPGQGSNPADLVPNKRRGIQEVALIASDLGFFPKTVFVTRDIPVRMFITGASKDTLCIMMDSFNVRKQVSSKKIEEITFTPKFPGQYRFYCPVNGMEGNLVVKEMASNNALN
ncbi:MAG: cupredoxin domain-containing protein [Bacteriovoracia bacterium]